MSRRQTTIATATPPASLSSSSNRCGQSVSDPPGSSVRRPRRLATTRQRDLLRQRVVSHLQQVEETGRRKGFVLRRSLRLHIKECNLGLPPTEPLQVILFGRKAISSTRIGKREVLPTATVWSRAAFESAARATVVEPAQAFEQRPSKSILRPIQTTASASWTFLYTARPQRTTAAP